MAAYRENARILYSFLTSVLEVCGQRRAPVALTPGKNRVTRWVGGCVGPRAVMSVLERKPLAHVGIRAPDHPSRSVSLYGLNYSGFASSSRRVEWSRSPWVRQVAALKRQYLHEQCCFSKLLWKRILVRPRHRWKVNIMLYLWIGNCRWWKFLGIVPIGREGGCFCYLWGLTVRL